MESMYDRQPACPKRTTGFLLMLKSVSPIIIVCSMLPGLAVIVNLKSDKNVHIIIDLFIFVSKKSLNVKWKCHYKSLFLGRVELQEPWPMLWVNGHYK